MIQAVVDVPLQELPERLKRFRPLAMIEVFCHGSIRRLAIVRGAPLGQHSQVLAGNEERCVSAAPARGIYRPEAIR
jgi:hypothetical protein